jgi:hypothetical protein
VANPWVHASFVSSELASRDRTYKHCKQAVLRIERDRERARRGAHLPICCPLCLEDFDPGSSEAANSGSARIHGAAAARWSATDEMTGGRDDVESQGGDGEESQPLLTLHHGLHPARAFDGARPGSTNPSMANFALAVSSDVTLLVLLVMARSAFDIGHDCAMDVPLPSTTVSLRCGHQFHTKCLTPMLLVVQDLCPVCLSNLFQTRVARGRGDWDSFYDEYMFRVRRVRRLYAAHVSDNMERRWLNVTPHAGSVRADPPMACDFEFRRLDGDSPEAAPVSATVPPS